MSQYRVCDRCRQSIDDTVKHREGWNTAGSIGGSLGGSMIGSSVGSAFGIVGSLAGAVGGALAGSRAGAEGSKATCNVVDKVQAGTICEACKTAEKTRRANYTNYGGGRLGDGTNSSSDGYAASAPPQPAGPGVGEQMSAAASTAGSNIQRGASTVGSSISGAASWVKQSVTGGGSDKKEAPAGAASGNGSFVPFGGSGQALGGAPAAPPRRSQMEDDEAMARRMQEEFAMEGQRR